MRATFLLGLARGHVGLLCKEDKHRCRGMFCGRLAGSEIPEAENRAASAGCGVRGGLGCFVSACPVASDKSLTSLRASVSSSVKVGLSQDPFLSCCVRFYVKN